MTFLALADPFVPRMMLNALPWRSAMPVTHHRSCADESDTANVRTAPSSVVSVYRFPVFASVWPSSSSGAMNVEASLGWAVNRWLRPVEVVQIASPSSMRIESE